jgi:hypothetical protein
VILRLFWLILLFMRLILVVCAFCRDMRATSVYFLIDDLFCCLCWSLVGILLLSLVLVLSGQVSVGPLWA